MRASRPPAVLLRRILLAALLGIITYCGTMIHAAASRRAQMKEDLKEISHITYGLFNVDEWREVLAGIITRKVEGLRITDSNRTELKAHIEKLMYNMLDEVQDVVERRNRNSGFSGVMRQIFMDVFVDIGTIRSGVPRYADLLLDYMEDPKNREELTGLVLQQFDELAEKTVGQVDYTRYKEITRRCGYEEKEVCVAYLQAGIDILHARAMVHLWGLLGATVAICVLLFGRKAASLYDLLIMVAAAACLLGLGVSLPMIDIEATISEFNFQLMGEAVTFKDQVLFYQSKSIVQVVQVLITDGGVGLVLVGVLVLAFSVIIPVAKIAASLICIWRGRAPSSKLHRFLVFKAGKWSMADVLVVAIFMAFIGFSGIVGSQLEQLREYSTQVQVLTTNNSDLQFGFYLFLAYCIMGLLLGVRLEQLRPKEN